MTIEQFAAGALMLIRWLFFAWLMCWDYWKMLCGGSLEPKEVPPQQTPERPPAAEPAAPSSAEPVPGAGLAHPHSLWYLGGAVPPDVTLEYPVATLIIEFQDGEEWHVPCDLEFAGLSESGFRVAYAAFESARASLLGVAKAPHLNSRVQRDLDRGL